MHRCRNTASLLKESGYRYESFSAFFFWVSRSTASLFPRGTRRTRQRSHSVWPFWRGGVPWGVPWGIPRILFVVVLPSAPSIGRGECLRAKVDDWQFQAPRCRDIEKHHNTAASTGGECGMLHHTGVTQAAGGRRGVQSASLRCRVPTSRPLAITHSLILISLCACASCFSLSCPSSPSVWQRRNVHGCFRPMSLGPAAFTPRLMSDSVGDMVICGQRKDGEISSARVAARTTIKLGNGKHNAGCSR